MSQAAEMTQTKASDEIRDFLDSELQIMSTILSEAADRAKRDQELAEVNGMTITAKRLKSLSDDFRFLAVDLMK